MLVPFLPSYVVDGEEELKFVKEPQSIGEMKSFYGNFTVIVKSTYLCEDTGTKVFRKRAGMQFECKTHDEQTERPLYNGV